VAASENWHEGITVELGKKSVQDKDA